MEQMRSEFDAWYADSKNHIVAKEVAWSAWQASRQAVEIELPTRKSAYASGYGDGYLVEQQGGEAIGYEETVEVLRAAGLRIKGE